MSYPPTRHHATKPISAATALSLLSTYLEATLTDASLHPNAILTENGPITPAVGESTGLVLHNLRRVQAGLKGEHLGALENDGEQVLSKPNLDNAVAGATKIPIGKPQDSELEIGGDWQDKEEFEREQDVVEGEIGVRDNAVHRSNSGYAQDGDHVTNVKATLSAKDKDARKKRKKQREKEEKARREKARKKQKKDADD